MHGITSPFIVNAMSYPPTLVLEGTLLVILLSSLIQEVKFELISWSVTFLQKNDFSSTQIAQA